MNSDIIIYNAVKPMKRLIQTEDGTLRIEKEHLSYTQKELMEFRGFLQNIQTDGSAINANYGFDEESKDEIIANPYFARMDFKDDTNNEVFVTYIGKKGVVCQDKILICDWRSDVGKRYYIKNQLLFIYKGVVYELLLRRTFDIKNGNLLSYENEFINADYIKILKEKGDYSINDITIDYITDPFLQRIFKQKHLQNTLTDIIISIQQNQNSIIISPSNINIVVQGCAGSGKTMIMLHRLSYIKYNEKNFNLSKIKILTPNNLFNMYINDLSNRLEIATIERMALEQYYVDFLSRYYVHERSLFQVNLNPIKLQNYMDFLYDNLNNPEVNSIIDSDSVFTDIQIETLNTINEFYNNTLHITELNVLLKKYSFNSYLLDTVGTNLNDISSVILKLSKIKNLLTDFYKQKTKFETLSEENAETAQKLSIYLQDQPDKGRALVKKFISKILSNIDNVLDNKTELNSEQLTERDFFIVAVEFEKQKNNLKAENLRLKILRNKIPFTDDEMELIESVYYKAKDFRVITHIILPLLKKLQDSRNIVFSFKDNLFIALLVNYQLSDVLMNTEKMLCIDEGQDLTVNEYKLLDLLNGGHVIFNIFGDTNQLINASEGISDWNKLREVFRFNDFTLSENYRNTSNIIDYCMRNLGISTKNIGINGKPVEEMSLKEFYSHLNGCVIGNRRIAIISKNKSAVSLDIIRNNIHKTINISDIKPNEIVFLSPAEAKGLEFEVCYVITTGMNKNEQYISFTRALNELYIVHE